MDWRAAARITNRCVCPWPCILLLAAVVVLMAPVEAQGKFGRGFVGHSPSARTPSNQPPPQSTSQQLQLPGTSRVATKHSEYLAAQLGWLLGTVWLAARHRARRLLQRCGVRETRVA
jgi:hypothetical protein